MVMARSTRLFPLLRLLPSCLALACGSGCGESESGLVPVRGTVLFEGRPISGAELTLHPQFAGHGWLPVSITAEDGTFEVGTRVPGDGAPAGRYRVTVVWHPEADAEDGGVNRLPARYAKAASTPIEIEVQPGSAEHHTINLTRLPGGRTR